MPRQFTSISARKRTRRGSLKSRIVGYLTNKNPRKPSPLAGPSLKEVVVEVRREKVPLTSLPSPKETILVSDDLSSCIEDEDYDIRISYSSSAAQDAPAAPDKVMLESSNDDVVILH